MPADSTDTAPGLSIPPFADLGPTEFDVREPVHSESVQADLPASQESAVYVPAAPELAAVQASAAHEAEAPPEAVAQATAPLPSSWLSATKSRREVPKAAKVGGAGIALLLLMVFALPHACGGPASSRSTSMIQAESDVEGAEFLKKRRHLTDDDFRRGDSGEARPVRATSAPAPTAPSLDIEERQRLRENNPEDLREARKKASGTPHSAGKKRAAFQSESADPEEPKSLLVFFNEDEPADDLSVPGGSASGSRRLFPAATAVRFRLTRDIVIRRGRTTVIAVVGKGERLPAGSKLLGSASADRDGTASIHFDAIVFPDGESLRARAEAVDVATGSPAIVGVVTGGRTTEDDGVARSVASSTAERAAFGALGGGVLSGAARQTISESGRHRDSPMTSPLIVTIARQSELEALFMREVRREGRAQN